MRKPESSSTVRIIFMALLAAIFVVPAFAKEKKDAVKSVADSVFTARYVFEHINSSSLEIIPTELRLDMLDYWDVDSVYKAVNVLNGLSWIDKVTDNYMKVTVSNVSSVEIKILPAGKEKIAMTVYTVGDSTQSEDSQVEFYDMDLNKLDSNKHLEVPDLKDFFDIPKGAVTKMSEIREMVPFPTVAYSASPDSDNLSARLTVEKYIDQDDWNIIKLFLKPSITLEWKKEKYKYK